MTVTQRAPSNRYLDRPSPSSLADVLDTILDKGLVIDIYVRVSLVGIEVITIDARIVIASVDTYLRFAEAVNRLDLAETEVGGLPELAEEGSKQVTKGAIEGVGEELTPSSSTARTAMKGVATAAAVGAAAVAARELASRMGSNETGEPED